MHLQLLPMQAEYYAKNTPQCSTVFEGSDNMAETSNRQDGKTGDAPDIRGRALVNGIHHVALTTDDLRMTSDFFVDVLGMTLVRAARLAPGMGTGPLNIGNPPFEQTRYYFFAFTEDLVVSVFEIPKGATMKSDRNAIGGMQELAFSSSPEQFEELQRRLKERDVPIIGPREILPRLFTIIFYDPNGIRMEALCDRDPSRCSVVESLVNARDQVKAELDTHGDPSWTAKMLLHWDSA
jgi:glyoxylase I family protein